MRLSLEALYLLVCILLLACSAKRHKYKHKSKEKMNTTSESNSTDLASEDLVDAGQRTLLLTVTKNSLTSQSCVVTNILALKGIADLGVLVVSRTSESPAEWEGVVNAAKTAGVVFRIRTPQLPHKLSVRISSSNSFFVTKLFFQMRARDWISLYDYVWMVDSDILFHRFDYAQFWLSHQNSFLHGPPLLAQPLIRQNTQSYYFGFNMGQWDKALGANYTRYVATNVYVEQQAPFFKAEFLLWLLDRLGPLLDKQLAMDNDWGAGGLWCGAAAHYIKNSDDQNHTSCGIVLVPIDHTNTKTIAKGRAFSRAGKALLAYTETNNVTEWSQWGTSIDGKLSGGVVFGPPNEHLARAGMGWTVVEGNIKLTHVVEGNIKLTHDIMNSTGKENINL
ncbi:hypothetical protein B484DRAFT_455749 [Ochromonadaceae sp. CCMP2298]|nr:hypothetical protein B484DRAFT_455749 [Ochromonadaceae sp. CCMP2298]